MTKFLFPEILCNCIVILKDNTSKKKYSFPRIIFGSKCQYPIQKIGENKYSITIDTTGHIFEFIYNGFYILTGEAIDTPVHIILPSNINKLIEILSIVYKMGINNECLVGSIIHSIIKELLYNYQNKIVDARNIVIQCCKCLGTGLTYPMDTSLLIDEVLVTNIIMYLMRTEKNIKDIFTVKNLDPDTMYKFIKYIVPYKYSKRSPIDLDVYTIFSSDSTIFHHRDWAYEVVDKTDNYYINVAYNIGNEFVSADIDIKNFDLFNDVKIILDNKVTINVNSLVLYNYSNYFRKLINKKGDINVIDLSDLKSKIEKNILGNYLKTVLKEDFTFIPTLSYTEMACLLMLIDRLDMQYIYFKVRDLINDMRVYNDLDLNIFKFENVFKEFSDKFNSRADYEYFILTMKLSDERDRLPQQQERLENE